MEKKYEGFIRHTHILLWALSDDDRLSEKARRLIENEENEIYYSIISLWEVERMVFITHDSLIPGYDKSCIMSV